MWTGESKKERVKDTVGEKVSGSTRERKEKKRKRASEKVCMCVCVRERERKQEKMRKGAKERGKQRASK